MVIDVILAEGQSQWAAILTAGLHANEEPARLASAGDPQQLALVLMNAHQGAIMHVTYRRSWPDPKAMDFALGYLRMLAAYPDT